MSNILRNTAEEAELISRAAAYATSAHHGIERKKLPGVPYVVHLAEVAALADRAGLGAHAVAAGWLHDSVEDTPVTIEDIIDEFGTKVGLLVAYKTDVFTNEAYPHLNRTERKRRERERLSWGSPIEQGLALCDLISNTTDIVRHDPDFAVTYLAEKREILKVLLSAPEELKSMAWAELVRAERELLHASLA